MSNLTYINLKHLIKTYWAKKGFKYRTSYDIPMGAATMHPATLKYVLNPKQKGLFFEQICKRPFDSFKGALKTRLKAYEQLQVLSYENITYDEILQSLNISEDKNIVQFLEDNWKSPTLGAYGIGHELRVNGVEIAQITRFYTFGGKKLEKPCFEITYGCERCYFVKYGKMIRNHISHFKERKQKVEDLRKNINNKLNKEYECLSKSYSNFLEINDIFNNIDSVSKSEKNDLMLKIKDKFIKLVEQYERRIKTN